MVIWPPEMGGWCYLENFSALVSLFWSQEAFWPIWHWSPPSPFQAGIWSPGNYHVDIHPPTPLLRGLPPPLPQPTGDHTLSGHDEAGHAVRHTGSGCQEGDPHDDVRNPQRVTDDCDLEEAERGGELKADSSPTCPWILWSRHSTGSLSRGQRRLPVWKGEGLGDKLGLQVREPGYSMELMFSNQRWVFFNSSFQLKQMAQERKNSVWKKAILG